MADLLSSLKVGNLNTVAVTKDGKDTLMFIEANPRLRTINIKDEKGVSLRRDELETKDMSQRQKLGESQGQKNNQSGRKKQGLSV